MTQATAGRRPRGQARTDRRLGVGIAVSLALHGLLLSLQFGVPGLDLGGDGGPIGITLAPSPTPATAPAPSAAPLAPLPDAPPASAPPPPAANPVPPTPHSPARGMRLVDLPPPPPPSPSPPPPIVQAEIRPPTQARARQRAKPRASGRTLREVPAPIIAAAPRPESTFTVPLPEIVPEAAPDAAPEAAPEAAPDMSALADSDVIDAPTEPADVEGAASGPVAQDADEERRRRLAEQEQELEQKLEQERLVGAERDAADARLAQELREQARLAQDRLEQDRLEQDRLEQERLERERLAGALAEQQRRVAEDEARAAQQREAERLQAQAAQAQADSARRQIERQRLEARRLAQEAAERERLEALAQQRLLEERARQSAQELAREQAARAAEQGERAAAERLARQQAEEAARQGAAQRTQAQAPGPGAAVESMPVGPGVRPGVGQGAGRGAGSGAGSGPGAGSLAGLPGNRARELLRGVTIPNMDAPPTSPDRAMGGRRVLADGGERDAPLRLYVDSVRQKLERNAVMGGGRLSLEDVRIDPLVSLSLRSDGSVDDVTIVRSSGRTDVDDAVRRFVRLNARYAAFPPNVAARFDIIEIRRIWRFADGLKLIEEMR